MGGTASKVSRKLPSKPAASLTGARTDAIANTSRPGGSVNSKILASETKNSSIEMDGGDPHFLQKLTKLGPVKVDHHMSTIRTSDHMKRVLESRSLSEQQAASHAPPRNRVIASELFDLLERRKNSRSADELKSLAEQHNVDVEVLERLTRSVNTPSPIEGSRQKVVDEEGQERYTVVAGWFDPPSQPNPSRLP